MMRPASPLALAICIAAAAFLAGCAAPGDPSPRHPVVPVAVTDLAARQYGNAVALTFTLPIRSLDRENLAERPTIEIYRSTLPSGGVPDKKTEWRLAYSIPSAQVDSYVKGDRIEFRDPLTSDDLAHVDGSSVAYKVRTRAAKVRASADSNVVTARVYPAPEAPRDIQVSMTESAVVLNWTQAPLPSGAAAGGYRVYRGEVESGQENAPREVSRAKLKAPLALAGPASLTDFSDSHVEFGTAYLYTVRSVAQFGADSVESADSAPVIVTPRDLYPPAAPAGLEASIVPATPQAPAYVELSWAISPEGDLAGYFVYRSDREDAPGERVHVEILPSPTFRDISVLPGRLYYYRVSAVDRAGNESHKSSAAQAEVP